MAHYRRRRPRHLTHGAGIDKYKKAPHQHWLGNWPKWWDVVNHTRPRRRHDRWLEREVMLDRIDADCALWAHDKKPHIYYW